MIIRRFVTALRKQDWTTVTIEFFIVVAGIFVGLQVDSWNSDRKDRKAEIAISARLIDDFRAIQDELDRQIAALEHSKFLADEVAKSLSGELSKNNLNDIAAIAARATFLAPPTGAKIYDELLSTGSINLIRSSEVRESLVTWGLAVQRFETALPVIVDEVFSKGQGFHDLRLMGGITDIAARQEILNTSTRGIDPTELHLSILHMTFGIDIWLGHMQGMQAGAAQIIRSAEAIITWTEEINR
jgi:hypothetical protein